MVNFYLGLIYYMRQDYANARAAFENALFKLRDYGEKKDVKGDEYQLVESDFVIAYIMLAKAHLKLGNEQKADDLFHRVEQLRPDLKPLVERARGDASNVLLVVDFGIGPQKVMEYDNSVVAFAPKPSEVGPPPRAQVRVDGQIVNLHQMNEAPIDLIVLAQERRWQSIDTIRLTKSVIGTGLMAVGAYQGAKHKPDYGAAAALIAGGALLKATATGDVRHWEMLPRTTYLLPLRLTPGQHDVTVSFPDRSGQSWRGIVAPAQGEATYYVRAGRTNLEQSWPPANYSGPAMAESTSPAIVPAAASANAGSVNAAKTPATRPLQYER
jgi:tetratricopeptide (TPR) repeat protein